MKTRIYQITFLALLFIGMVVFVDRSGRMIDQVKHEAKFENPDERRLFEIMKRGGEIDPVKVEKGRKIFRDLMAKEMEKPAMRDGGIAAWQDLGPKNIGGRIRAIAIHPINVNTILVGAAAGGIWKSTDGGVNWTLKNPTVQAYPVTSIVYDPFDSSILYAATGEYRGGGPEFPGVGVLKSVDGGESWSVLNTPQGANFMWLSKIEMNPLLENSFFVAGTTADINGTGDNGSQGVLYRSNDGGNSWITVWIGTSHIYDLEINPNDTSEIVIGTNSDARISSNSGVVFNNEIGNAPNITVPNGWLSRRCEVEYCLLDPTNIYVSHFVVDDVDNDGFLDSYGTRLWRTTNGGGNWSLLSSTTGTGSTTNPLTRQGNYSHSLWSDPSDCTRALLGGIDLWKWQSNNLTRITDWIDDISGNSATGTNNSVHADFHVIIEEPGYDGTTNKKVWLGNDGGVYGTNDIWAASLNSGWFARNTELNITQLYGADISLSGDTIIGGAQDNSYFIDVNSSNGLQTWSPYSTGDGGFCAVNKTNTSIIYSTTQNGSVYRSTDGGATFCNIARLNGGAQFGCCPCGNFFNNGGVTDNPSFISPFQIDPINQSQVYFGANQLWRGANNGNNWTPIKASVGSRISSMDFARDASGVAWVGYVNGRVDRRTSLVSAWDRVDTNDGGINVGTVTDIAISPLDANRVMLTAGGYNQNNIYLTEDGGITWELRNLGFDMHIETVTWHPTIPNWVYVGTDVGMFASQDNGLSWSVAPIFGNNEGPVYTQVAELFWQGDGSATYPYYLCAATHGRGLWRSFAPVVRELYVDKNCSFCGLGTEAFPYKTFREAFDKAGPGSRIVFKTAGIYEEGAPTMLVNEDIEIVKADGVIGSVIIK
jgi:hypothetical protein